MYAVYPQKNITSHEEVNHVIVWTKWLFEKFAEKTNAKVLWEKKNPSQEC